MARQRLMQWSAAVLVLGLVAGAVTMHIMQQSASAGAAGSPQAKPEPQPTFRPTAKAATGDDRRPLGTWERAAGPVHITLTCTPERLEGLIVLKLKKEEGGKVTVDFRADYSVTRDSVLYGVVTSAGIRTKVKGDAEGLLEEQAFLDQALVDQPFSFRFRQDDDILTLKDLRFHLKREDSGDLKEIEAEIAAMGPGRYNRKASAKPKAAPAP